MRDARLIQKLYCEPLMLSAAAFDAFDRVLSARMAGGPTTPAPVRPADPGTLDAPMAEYLQYYRQARATREQLRVEDVLRKYGSVAIIKVHGAIDRNLSQMELDCSDACDLQDVNNAAIDCRQDSTIRTVIFDFDTPGGTCVGHAETADLIALLAAEKEVIAWIGGECCSLGYYLASQCDLIVIGASAWAGSIGVRCARLDATANLKAQGLQYTLIASSEQKTDGSPAKPMTEAERQRLQTRCMGLYEDFKARVRAGRPNVSDDVMQAQIYHGREAIEAGLADDLGSSLDDLAEECLALNMGLPPVPATPALATTARAASAPVLADPGATTSGSDFEAANKNHGKHGRFAPGRKPVSALHNLHANLSDEQRAVIAHTHAAIDKVHGVPADAPFAEAGVVSNPRMKGAKAKYMKGPLTGDIEMKPGVTNEAGLLEEVGHHLDHQMGGRDFASKGNDLKGVNEAIERSAAVKDLNRKARSAEGRKDAVSANLREAAQPEEKFARAYTQYIATKSGDEKIMAQVKKDRSSPYFGKQKYWSDEDFSPILKAFDSHLEKQQWK